MTRRLVGLLGVALAILSAVPAAAGGIPGRISQRLDDDFLNPNDPEVFRALTGQGDPGIPPEDPVKTYYDVDRRDDAALVRRLFPTAEQALYFDVGVCRPDYALAALKARIAQLGPDHPYVRKWIEVQQAVFSACVRRRSTPAAVTLPPPLLIEDPALAKLQSDDRAYQAAALAFYLDDRQGALKAFAKIAKSRSPHGHIAIYMMAAIRAGSNRGYWDMKPMIPAAKAQAEVQAILADPSLADIHPLAQELLGWIGASVADEATRLEQVRSTLTALETPSDVLAKDPVARRRYALARHDLDFLHAASEEAESDWWLQGGPPTGYTASLAMMRMARTDPMAAWVLFPQPYLQGHAWAVFEDSRVRGWEDLRQYAVDKSQLHDRASGAWEHMRLAVATGSYDDDDWRGVDAEETRAAAGDVQALAALSFDFYHLVRLAVTSYGTSEERAQRLDAAIARMKAFPLKDTTLYAWLRGDALQYLMTVGRLDEARRWRDALYAPPEGPSWQTSPELRLLLAEDEDHFVAALDPETQDLPILNGLSIATLRRLASRPDTPALLRAKFARVAWARTYALGRTVDANLDQLTRQLNPDMTRSWTHHPGAVRPNDRRALLDVLRSPALNIVIADVDRDAEPRANDDERSGLTQIDIYNHDDDNWWCRWKVGHNERALQQDLFDAFFFSADLNLIEGAAAYRLREKLRPVLAQSFAMRSRDPAEIEALSRIPCAPRMLTERVLDWVNHPRLFETRAGQAEALALAVKTTRYGCYSDGPHGAYSRAAWELLHRKFPDTDWAKRTKYWFNCLYGKTCPAVEDP